MYSAVLFRCVLISLVITLSHHTIVALLIPASGKDVLTSGMEVLSGTPDKMAMVARASQIHFLVPHYNQFRVYPDMRLNCTGRITAITLLGYTDNIPFSSPFEGLSLQLWHETLVLGKRAYPNDTNADQSPTDATCIQFEPPLLENVLFQNLQPVDVTSRSTDAGGVEQIEITLEQPVVVLEDSVLGIQQRQINESSLTLLYQEWGGPRAYILPTNDDCLHQLNESVGGYDYPLIAVTFESFDLRQDAANCVHGFKTPPELAKITTSRYINTHPQPLQSGEHRLHLLGPRFTCGGYVTSWKVGAERGGESEAGSCPELQIWEGEGVGQFERQVSTRVCGESLIRTNHSHVYDVVPTNEVRFEDGYYLGLHQPPIRSLPPTRLSYVPSLVPSLVSFHDLPITSLDIDENGIVIPFCGAKDVSCSTPLVAARVACDPGCNGRCTDGFMDRDELILLSALLGGTVYASDNTYIFPDMTFTQSGSVVGWEFAARSGPLTPENIYLPHIEIYRRCGDLTDCYTLHDTTFRHDLVLEQTENYNMYWYMLDTPMEVEEGDVIAIHQPPLDVSRLSLAFLHDTGFCHHIVSPSFETVLVSDSDCEEMSQLQPLVAPQLLQQTPPSPSGTSSQPGPTPSPPRDTTPSPEEDEEELPVWVWSVVGVAGFLLVLLVVTILVVCFGCFRAKKAGNPRDNERGSRNIPTNGSLPSLHNESYDAAIPTTFNMAYIYSCPTAHNVAYGARRNHAGPQSTRGDHNGPQSITSGDAMDQLVDNGTDTLPYDYVSPQGLENW